MAPRTRQRRVTLLAAALVALLATACSTPSGTAAPSTDPTASDLASPGSQMTVTDARGAEVTIDGVPERIVSLAPSNTEIVCALNACDRLVGVTDFDDYPPEVADVADVVVSAQVDVERVVDAQPDLVLAAGNELTPTSVITQLEGLGLTVIVLYPESLDEVTDDIELLGGVLDEADAAASLVAGMRQRVGAITAAVEGLDRPRTLYEVYYAEGVTYTAGEGSFLASLIELAGGEPVTGDAQGTLPAEQLVAADPQLVLLGTASYDPSLATPAAALEAVRARPGWSELSAVRDAEVLPYLDDIVTTRPGPRIVDGLEALARAIHPEAFE
ncbi:MAG TPA: ABC transporter substrate-binding protein [Candidatus Limnocylindria bacterium]|nr:ABC transporter substrate-binding protein [Candidatus Limnocylindria bacterium]